GRYFTAARNIPQRARRRRPGNGGKEATAGASFCLPETRQGREHSQGRSRQAGNYFAASKNSDRGGGPTSLSALANLRVMGLPRCTEPRLPAKPNRSHTPAEQ